MFVCSLCHSVCVQNYCKSNQPISLKLDVKIWPSYQSEELVNFGGDSVPGTDSGSLFHFPHHCGIADFR